MKNIYTAVLIALTAMLHAQNSVSGIVTDSSGKPLHGVSISSPELDKGTISDENGKYFLGSLPSGNANISISFLGFKTIHKKLHVENSTVLDLVMEESIHEMDEVIVSTAFKKLQSQNVMKVEHASLKSIRQKGISTLAEGLTTVPGVSQISTGNSIGKPVIRGLSGNRVLVYSQGVRLENQQFGDEHGLGLNDSGIESVEVIKGPASLLYGSDALGGVIYLNPEKFAVANSITTDASQKFYTNTLGSKLSIGLKESTQNWKFLSRGAYSSHADYAIADGLRVTNTRYNESDFKAAVGYGNSSFSSVLRYNFNRLDLGIPETGIGGQSQSHDTEFPKQAADNHIISLHNNFFMKRTKLDVNLGYIFNDRREFEDNDDATLHMKLRTLNYDVKFHLPKSEKIETIAGIQGMFQENGNFGSEYLIPNATTTDAGIFITSNYSWKSNVLQAGIRYDNRKIISDSYGLQGEEGYFEAINRTFNSFNASLGFKTSLMEQLTMRVNLASGFRAPNLAELTSNGVHEGTNRYEIGNVGLKNEQNFQADINIEYKGSHFEFFINGFYNHINDYISPSPTGQIIENNNVYVYAQEDARLYGGEAGIHLHPHPFDWLHLESSFETVTGENANGGYLSSIPANSLSNTLRAEFKRGKWLSEGFARIDAVSAFAQKNVSGFETQSPGYTLLNAGVGGNFKIAKIKFEASINGNNLLDKSYIAHLSRLKPDGIFNIGRNIIFGISFAI